METQTLFLIGFVAFIISIISAIGGYAGFLMILSLSFFFDIKTSIAFSTIFFLFSTINKVFFYHKAVDWEFYRTIIIGILPALALSLYFFKVVDPMIIKYILIITAIYMILEHFFKLPRINNFTKTKMILGGMFWGFLGGISAPGSIKVMLLKWRGLTKEAFIGTGAMISFTLLCIKIPSFIYLGYLKIDNYSILLPIAIIVSFGTFIGKQILQKISVKNFDYIVLVLVFLSIVKFLVF